MAYVNLSNAKQAKNDEFYTQYGDIEKEISAYLEYNPHVFKDKTILLPCDDPEWSNFTKYFAQNFERFGLKKLISTSYAVESKPYKIGYQATLFEESAPHYNSDKTRTNGKIFTLDKDISGDGKIDVDDLEWKYLEGDGDFNSQEVKKLRDESDIIITNPPFSLFREFLNWIIESKKQFTIIGNINTIPTKEVFPLIKNNVMWLGTGMGRWISGFIVPKSYELYRTEAKIDEKGNRIIATNNCIWLTNIEHGKRHLPLNLMSMADNKKFNTKLQKKPAYLEYENYDGIEIPYTDAIPNDYDGIMGVPISFLDKYNPDQFEILDCQEPCILLEKLRENPNIKEYKSRQINYNGNRCQKTYHRIFIKHKQTD